MFKYLWIVVVLLTYVPWTLWTLIDLVRIFLKYRPLTVERIYYAFDDWVGEHETWVILHLGIFILLVVFSFATWGQATWGN